MSSSSLLAQGIRSTALQIDYGGRVTAVELRTRCGASVRPAKAAAGIRRHSAPRNSPASQLRHTAASVQITVAPPILHPKDGGDPDDPSQITSSARSKASRKATLSVCDLLWDLCCQPLGCQGVRVLAAVPFERSIEGKRTRLDGPDCQNDRCLHREKGLTAAQSAPPQARWTLFLTINICTVMTASHDVSVALSDSRELAARGLCRGPKAGGLHLSRTRQDKTRAERFFQQTFRATHMRWSDPMQALNKDRTAESDP